VHGGDWDVVIDDGSHISSDIITTHSALWPHLKSGGIYEIEDLGSAPEAAALLMGRFGLVLQGIGDTDSITFSRELCVMRKK
jgi:hypothetical protein